MSEGNGENMRMPLSEFSDEERRFIALHSAQPEPGSALLRLLSYGAFFFPGVVIGIYGLLVQSFQAVAIAFLILVTNLCWSLAGIFREQRSLELSQIIFRKLQARLDAER